MKAYKIFRWFLKASALTTVMFVMQACYGSPNMSPVMPDDMELTDENTVMDAHEAPVMDSVAEEIEAESL